jgi:general secretion pathway protein F
MPVFSYKALATGGETRSGVVDADSPKDARRKLREMKLMPTEVAPVSAAPPEAAVAGLRFRLLHRRDLAELSLMTRQLGTLISAGIPLMGALTALSEQTEDRRVRTTLLSVREAVARGSSLSDAMAAQPHLFNDLYVNMVRAGEASGALDSIFFRLADYLAAQHRLRAKIVAALTYPCIVVVAGLIIVVFMMVVIVPKITLIFTKYKKTLPLPTEILIGTSNLLVTWWWLLLAGAIGVGAGWWTGIRTDRGRLWWDTLMLRVPVLGQLFRKAAVSRFAVTLATLLESGLPVLESLTVVQRVVANRRVADTLEVVRRKIAEGADIATPLKQSGVFPPVVTYMVAVGEESGRLDALLRKVAEAYDEEIEIASQKLTAALEPLLTLAMAAFVFFIVISILMPIMQMAQIK